MSLPKPGLTAANTLLDVAVGWGAAGGDALRFGESAAMLLERLESEQVLRAEVADDRGVIHCLAAAATVIHVLVEQVAQLRGVDALIVIADLREDLASE